MTDINFIFNKNNKNVEKKISNNALMKLSANKYN